MQDPKKLYEELVKQGMHPKDAAKEAQERTGLSCVTGKPIRRVPQFSKKPGHKAIGQYGSV